jgi:hypothetical protein
VKITNVIQVTTHTRKTPQKSRLTMYAST